MGLWINIYKMFSHILFIKVLVLRNEVFIIFASLFFFNSLFAQSFEPGLWRSKENLEINGLPLPSTTDEECITMSQAKDAKATIEKELNKQGCRITKWIVKNKKLDAEVNCKNEDLEASGKLQGQFTKKNYDLVGEAQGTYKQLLPAVAVLKLSGHWVKKCSK